MEGSHRLVVGGRPGRRVPPGDVVCALVLVLIVAATFCVAYGRTGVSAWRTPINYRGDSLFLLAYLKAASEGHVLPGASLEVPELNAPFAANWNDHPRTLRAVFALTGLLSRLVGLFAALNLLLLLAHVLAALSMFAVARHFGARREWAALAGLAFGLSHFLFWRSLWHLDLALVWHIPLCVMVVSWAFSTRGIALRSRRFLLAAAVTVIAAVHNPYYALFYVQFLFLAALAQVLRGRRQAALAPLALVAVLGLGFLLDNAGSLAYQLRHGFNQGASRPYGNLERFALKPLELLLAPPGFGLADWWRLVRVHWTGRIYRNEGESTYLGLVGAAGLLWLGGQSLARLLRRPAGRLHPTAGAVAWTMAFSIVGGLNQLAGLVGFDWLRGTNRLSVWILALVLLFLATRRLALSPRVSVLAAAVLAVIVLLDQVPFRGRWEGIVATRVRVEQDRAFVARLEAELPPRSMLFMLPVVDFPEGRRVLGADEYDHLRPFLFSRRLRFSFGSDVGRAREKWQRALEAQPTARMVQELESRGFAGVLVDRVAYPAEAAELIQEFGALGRPVILTSGDYSAIELHPAASVAQKPR